MQPIHPRGHENGAGTRTVLVVDDDHVFLRIQDQILTSAGYRVFKAATGNNGLELIRGKKPDVVLHDVVLPDGSGLDFCRRIKSDPAMADTRILFLSGVKVQPEDKAAGLRAGADGYLLKPVQNDELLAQIEAVLRIKAAEEALVIRNQEIHSFKQQLQAKTKQLETVLNSIDSLVYVADMETHDLLFINDYARKMGLTPRQKCWQTLQKDMAGPCPFCTNDKLVDAQGRPTGVHVWEFQNTLTCQWFECRDQVIAWNEGRLVRLEIATDVTARKQAVQQTEIQLRLIEYAAGHSSSELMTKVLDEIERFLESSISFLHVVDSDQRTLSL